MQKQPAVPDGWSAEGWAVVCQNKARACEADHPEKAAEHRRASRRAQRVYLRGRLGALDFLVSVYEETKNSIEARRFRTKAQKARVALKRLSKGETDETEASEAAESGS